MTFWYFGYGANMCGAALRAKGILALHSEPASMAHHRFAFALRLFSPFVGGVATVLPDGGGCAHGVLHLLPDSARQVLDEIEGQGFLYERRSYPVTTYAGVACPAEVYVGLAEWQGRDLRPTQRYRNILVRGAEAHRLDPEHVDMLRHHPVEAPRSCRSPRVLNAPSLRVSEVDVARRPDWLAVSGFVFELTPRAAFTRYMQNCRPKARDLTLAFLQMMEDPEPTDDLGAHPVWRELSWRQRAFIGPFLESLHREHRLVGRLASSTASSSDAPPSSRFAA